LNTDPDPGTGVWYKKGINFVKKVIKKASKSFSFVSFFMMKDNNFLYNSFNSVKN